MSEIIDRLKEHFAGRYHVDRQIGHGGMATVYLATDIRHEREVAIKVLHPDLSATIGAERFEREIKLAAKLQHPHVLGLYDSGTADGLLYYVMPFIRGESLRDRLDRDKQLPIDDAIQYTLEVADALGYAHSHDVVHRDIKPENVLISNGHALVADFGIARARQEAGQQRLTQTGMAVGTPIYMSPEQATGQNVGPAADIYSLGCMLYEMLAGEPPFTGPNAMAIMAKHAMEGVPSVRITRPSVPEEIEEAIFAAMEKSVADRPKTVAEFCEILGTPLGTTATRRITPSRHTASRRVPTGAALGARQVTLPSTPIWRRTPIVLGGLVAVVSGVAFGAWALLGGPRNSNTSVPGLPQAKIAVLYFTDESADKSLAFLADGLTESLIQELSPIRELKVISKEGVTPYRASELRLDSIAQALGAGTLIEGSLTPIRNDQVRVTVRLVDGATGAAYRGGTATFEESTKDLLATRRQLVTKASELLRSRLGQEFEQAELREGTRNDEALSLVLRAENSRKDAERAARDADTTGALARYAAADSFLIHAAQLDRAWSEPLALRSVIAYGRSQLSKPLEAKALIDSGIASASRALEIDRNNAGAFESRGALRYRTVTRGLASEPGAVEQLVDSAEADFQSAVRLDATRASSHVWLSRLYYRKYDIPQAFAAANAAYTADVFLREANEILWRLFATSYDLQNFVPATQWCDSGRKKFPANPAFARCRLLLLSTDAATPDDVAEAWRLVDTIATLSPVGRTRVYNRLDAQILAAVVIGKAGLVDSAKRVLVASRADREIDPRGELMGFEAFARAQIGDKDEAFAILQRYLAANPEHRPGFGKLNSWWWDALRGDRRYQRIVGSGS